MVFERSFTISKNLRVNERIRVPEVRVIDDAGEQLGIMKTRDALILARSQNVDLVEVAPNAQPPVCRIMDYGKYRYEQGKKEKEARKSQKVITIKEVRLRPKIGDQDLKTKGNQARVFLEDGHKVKMTVLFRGREMAHQDIGREVLNEMIDMLKDVATIEQAPRVEGRNMSMMLSRAASKSQSQEPRQPRPARPEQAAPASRPEQAAPAPSPEQAAPAPRPEQAAAPRPEQATPAPRPTPQPQESGSAPTATAE